MLALVNALNEVLSGPSAIDESEFQLRIGVSRAAARQTVQRFSGASESTA